MRWGPSQFPSRAGDSASARAQWEVPALCQPLAFGAGGFRLHRHESGDCNLNLAEYATRPKCMLVHDPVAPGALRSLDGIEDSARLEQEWLFRSRPDERIYASQHRVLVETLSLHVERVQHVADIAGDHEAYTQAYMNPNQVFTRDSLITLPWVPDGYIAACMKPLLRRAETRTMQVAVERLGLREITRVPKEFVVEGGDLVPFHREGRRSLLAGYGPRTHFEALEYLQDALIPDYADEIIALQLAPWRMNLDGGLLPVAEDVLITESESILGGMLLNGRERQRIDVLEMMRDLGMFIVETTRDESVYAQSCNCVCLGDRKIIYFDLCDRVHQLLVRHDIETLRVPGSELVKGRGGPRCMTRPIYGP